jgi:RNA polymerase sigma factor (sigma-70 family)
MVTGAALCDPEGGLLEEAGRQESPATHATQPEHNAQEAEYNAQEAKRDAQQAQWNLPTWEDIVHTHSARVYRLAYRLTGNPHDAEDLTQEVFVRVFRSLSSYTPGTFEGWLHRITTNLFLDSARRKQRIRFEGLADDMAHRLAGSEPTPAQAFDDSHLDDDVQAALKALPPEYRAAVVLCDIEGFSYEEIAATLGVKLGTVRSRIHRGRAQLRAALEHRRPGPVAVSHGPAGHAVTAAAGNTGSPSAGSPPAGNEAARGQGLRRQGLVPPRLKRAGGP